MGRYFGRQPRYSQEEAEAQAKAALDAAVKKGRPPEEEWKALGSRMGDINRELAARPPVDLPGPPPRPVAPEEGNTRDTGRPRAVNQILRPPAPAPEPAPPRRPRRPAEPTPPRAARAPKTAPPPPAKRATAAPAKTAKPVKRSAGATEKGAPAAAKRPAAKKRPE